MPLTFSLFSRKKSRPFKDFYSDWFVTLRDELLPLIHNSLSSSSPTLLASHVDILLRHIISYYDALDLAADPATVPYLLFPPWRNPMETPFLFLGDLHPYLFTNLLRSFIDRENDAAELRNGVFCELGLDQIEERSDLFDKPLTIFMAWKDPTDDLVTRMDQIQRAMRLMVPELMGRVRKVQATFLGRVAELWASCRGKKNLEIEDEVKEVMDEMVSVFVDANRLRRSVIMDIVGATSEYQAAMFLEGLAQFLVGFRDPVLLREFEHSGLPGAEELHFGV